MDHSYRAGDANYADAPPSTIQVHGHRRHRGHHGDNQPLDFSGPRPVPIPEDAQTHIYLFIEDLFLTAKINEAARKLGVKVAFVKNEKEALAELMSGDDENKPSLIVFDLNNANAKPLTTIPKIKTKLKRSVSIVGFLSHLQGDLKAKAVEAGCDVVMPRAAFSQNLPNLLRRYGVDSEEEVNFNY
jgi:PleD family two-component response regulator